MSSCSNHRLATRSISPSLYSNLTKLIGNKVDMEDSKRTVTQKRARNWAKEHSDMPYFETSAKEGINVNDAFYMIAKNALKQEQSVELFKYFGLT
jgi:Ras-related protein Rab-7A